MRTVNSINLSRFMIFSLIVGLSTCLSTAVFAQDPGDNPGPTEAPPEIEGFSVTYLETQPDVWEYTFVGRVVNGPEVAGRTVEIFGGPFDADVTTNSAGDFEAIVTISGGPALGVRVYAVVTENGNSVSPLVHIDL